MMPKRNTQEKSSFVRDVQAGKQVEDIFLVRRFARAETKGGKPYLSLTLGDKSGEIEARLWDNADEYAPLAQEGCFVRVQAVVEEYREQKQFKLLSLASVEPKAVKEADFVQASPRDFSEMQAEFQGVLQGIRHPGLQALLAKIFQGETLENFLVAPAAKKMHHAYRYGLLEHTLGMAELARAISALYPALNADLLICGALLHDLAKIDEYDWAGPAIGQTAPGLLLGHLVLGAERIHRAAAECGLDADMATQLAHMVASHHGRREYGAAAVPATPEAVVLHYIDQIDAKMNAIAALQEELGVKQGEYRWTPFQIMFEGPLYLGKAPEPVAPAALPALATVKTEEEIVEEEASKKSVFPCKLRARRRLGKMPGSPRLPQKIRDALRSTCECEGCGHEQVPKEHKRREQPEKKDETRQLGLF